MCVMCLLAFAPRLAPALELGPIEARSALYEPLDARIPVRDVRSGDLEGLRVELGSPAQFELAGIARLQHLDLLEFIVVVQDDGGGYIRVRTDEPIIEPLLTFLIDVDWPRGRTVRGYRLHLAPSTGRAAGTRQSARAAPEPQPSPETGASGTGASEAPPVSPPASGGTRYGPVRTSETLWSIAARLRPDDSVSVQRMMLAILEANPEAFAVRNVNALNAGSTLHIPDRGEIGPDDVKAAIAEVERQHSAWTEYRRQARPATTPAPPAPTPPPAPPAPTPPPDPEPAPGGRIEVVSPDTTAAVETVEAAPEREDGAEMAALRKELALALEEADASRREYGELELRLADAEDRIRELSRLVDLRNEEIAALQVELRTLSETAPAPAPAEAEPTPAPAEAEPAPAQPEPGALPFGLGALPVNPVFLVGGAGLLLILLGVVALLRRRRTAAGEDEAEAGDEAGGEVGDSGEPSSAGEADLLQELEAVAADLADESAGRQDRRSGAAPVAVPAGRMKSGAARYAADGSGLDAVAEERGGAALWEDALAAEGGALAEADPAADRGAGVVSGPDDDSGGTKAAQRTPLDDLLDDDETDALSLDAPLDDDETDALSLDAPLDDDETDALSLDAPLDDDETDALSLDDPLDDDEIGALSLDDPLDDDETGPPLLDAPLEGDEIEPSLLDSPLDDGETEPPLLDIPLEDDEVEPPLLDTRLEDDEFEPPLLDDLLDDDETEPPLLDDLPDDDETEPPLLDDSLDDGEAGPSLLDAPPEDGGTGPSLLDDPLDDGEIRSLLLDEPSDDDGTMPPLLDDSLDDGEMDPPSLDDSLDDGGMDSPSLDDLGEDEAQTKIDLAQVYMEMGDTESARGFLEAVLAEGDAEQRETARGMLSQIA